MLKIYDKYKGVILFVAVLVVMTNLLSINVKHLNEIEQQTAIATYEK